MGKSNIQRHVNKFYGSCIYNQAIAIKCVLTYKLLVTHVPLDNTVWEKQSLLYSTTMSGILLLFPVCSVSVSILGSVRWEGVVVGCAVYGICINCASCFPFHKIRKNDTIAILQNEHSISHSVLFLPPPPQFLKFPLLFYTEVASQNKTALQ